MYYYWVYFLFFIFYFLRIRLGWAFGYLFRTDVGLFFLGLLCKILTNLFYKIIRFYIFFFLGGAESYTFGFGRHKFFFFFFKDFSSKFVWHKFFLVFLILFEDVPILFLRVNK